MLEELIQKSSSLVDAEFSSLIKTVSAIHRQERSEGFVGDSNVSEGLVKVKKGRKLVLVGDLHGDFETLVSILKRSGFFNELSSIIVFLGDYGDRGKQSVEVYSLVLQMKNKYSERVILMRGNHEGPEGMPFGPHDLPNQLNMKFGVAGQRIYDQLRAFFDLMYHGVVLENSYLILHGGVPVSFRSKEDIATANKTNEKTRYLEEILWNDPREIEGFTPSGRGYGKYFGKKVTQNALNIFNAKALIRAHEVCNGFKVNHDGLVLTLFSCKAPYRNHNAGFLSIDQRSYKLDAEELSRLVELV